MDKQDLIKHFDWLHCDNKELINELAEKEYLFNSIKERILRCHKCKTGHFFLERDDREYSSDAWWMCDNCLECHATPSKLRERMIWDIVEYGYDEYWDYEIFDFIQTFEYTGTRTYSLDEPKTREFNVEIFNREKHFRTIRYDDKWQPVNKLVIWEEFVEEEIRKHIKVLDKALQRAKNYKMLQQIFDKEK